MKRYHADRHGRYVLQVITPVLALFLIFLSWYFLPFLPHWLLWLFTIVFVAVAVVISVFLLPLWFATLSYTISDTHITKKSGILFTQEQTMRTQALQYSRIFRIPFLKKNGIYFIPLHAYGGTIYLSFLRKEDAKEIQEFLQHTVYCHVKREAAVESVEKPEKTAQNSSS